MNKSTISTYLRYMQLQVVAEAFLTNMSGTLYLPGSDEFNQALIDGNKHTSKLTTPEIKDFQANWKVVAQQANTDTGFSGTLFKTPGDNPEYVISFRSTEFVEDNIRDRAVGRISKASSADNASIIRFAHFE
ncbi:hypothetical protein [Methylomonas albis]|uniref:Lipocalin-like domain-containing protein n=1 Tax=Methylomonas albis TaxID=1854563 RepID=A0ABR9CVK8_9GAMM|nr:hypothetical protein [Methylomonas albis]MBD9354859.1 hypothetical protein [Methylomonas albis]